MISLAPGRHLPLKADGKRCTSVHFIPIHSKHKDNVNFSQKLSGRHKTQNIYCSQSRVGL